MIQVARLFLEPFLTYVIYSVHLFRGGDDFWTLSLAFNNTQFLHRKARMGQCHRREFSLDGQREKQEQNWTENHHNRPNGKILKLLLFSLFVQVNTKQSDNWILRIPRQRPKPRITLMHIIKAQAQELSGICSLNVSRQSTSKTSSYQENCTRNKVTVQLNIRLKNVFYLFEILVIERDFSSARLTDARAIIRSLLISWNKTSSRCKKKQWNQYLEVKGNAKVI